MADDQPQDSAGVQVLAPNQITSVTPPSADQPADFSSGKFTIDDLKQLDIETKSDAEIQALANQLLAVIKPDGIWDGQKVFNVPILGHQATNLITQLGVGSGKPPIEQTNVLFAVEIAYFIAQIAQEVQKRDLFEERLKNVYRADEAEDLLTNWAETTAENLTVRQILQTNAWPKVVNALLDSNKALAQKIAATAATSEEPLSDENGGEVGKVVSTLAAGEVVKNIASGAGGDSASGGEGVATSTTTTTTAQSANVRERAAMTAPQDVMRLFLHAGGGELGKASNQAYLRGLDRMGFSADERRLIVDQTAWIYNGVLAQVFPSAVGHFESLSPEARVQINQLVRDYMLQYAGQPEVLRNLIANPLARSRLIADILQQNSPQLSVLAQRDPARLESDLINLNREELIAQQTLKLADYLTIQAQAQGTELTAEQATQGAFNALSKLTHAQLEGLAAGEATIRTNVYTEAAQRTSEDTFVASVTKINIDLRKGDQNTLNLIQSLNGFLLDQAPGQSIDDLIAIVGGLPANRLLEIAGVEDSSPLYPRFVSDIEAFRNSIQFYVQTRGLELGIAQKSGGKSLSEGQHGSVVDIQNLSREELIERHLPDLSKYLLEQSAAVGKPLMDQEAAAIAREELTHLNTSQLRELAAGSPAAVNAVYETVTRSAVNKTLVETLSGLSALGLDERTTQQVLRGLERFVKQEGDSLTDAVSRLDSLPPAEFLQLIGISQSQAAALMQSDDFAAFRASIVWYVEARATRVPLPERILQQAVAETKQAPPSRLSMRSTGTPTTARDIQESGKKVTELAENTIGTTAHRSKAFFKHYLEHWNNLTVEEQTLVYLLTDKQVPKMYQQRNPPTDLLEPAMGFIEIESKLKSDAFLQLLDAFKKDPNTFFRSRDNVLKAQQFLETGKYQSVDAPVELPEAVQQAAAFEQKYQNSWATLSQDERITVYLIAGLTVEAGRDLKVPFAYVDLVDSVGTPEFNALVEIVKTNKSVLTSSQQQADFTKFISEHNIDMGNSEFLAMQQYEDIATALLFFDSLDAAAQLRVAKMLGFESPNQLRDAYKYAANKQFGDTVLIPASADDGKIYPIGEEPTYVAVPVATTEAMMFAQAVTQQEEHEALLRQYQDDANSDLENQVLANYSQSPAGSSARRLPFGKNARGAFSDVTRGRKTGNFKRLKERAAKARKAAVGAAKKITSAIDKGISAGLLAVPVAGGFLSKAWNSRTGKAIVATLFAPYMYALSTPAGALGAVAGGLLGTLFPILGPATPFIGSYAGALVGAYGPWNNGGSFLPWKMNLPWQPGAESAASSVFPTSTAVASQIASNPSIAGEAARQEAVRQASALQAQEAAKEAARQAAVNQTVANTGGNLGAVFMWPMFSLGSGAVMAMMVLLVIWGAFIAPSPTTPLPAIPPGGDLQTSSKYITVTKSANPSKFDNPGTTEPITYTITVAPKDGYKINIKGFTDEYSSFGETPVELPTTVPTFAEFNAKLQEHIAGPGALTASPTEPRLSDTFTFTYTIPKAIGEDAYLTNKVVLTFDVYNYLSENPLEVAQDYTTSAAVIIGEPKVGCWPVGGIIYSVPFAGVATHVASDSFDISGNAGQTVSAPFPGRACSYTGWNDGYGNHVRIFADGAVAGYSGQTLEFIFAHLNSFSPELSSDEARCALGGAGVPVVPGSQLGFVGSTGNSEGPHLHYELYTNVKGKMLNGQYSSILRLLVPDGVNTKLFNQVTSSCSGV